jgi:hypothetical protein
LPQAHIAFTARVGEAHFDGIFTGFPPVEAKLKVGYLIHFNLATFQSRVFL